ncbi:glycosyltransferase [Sphingobium sp. CAP-1]|uniref:glycosyltransferase n=1 Tax=Sphingobium sp. CAP-1 TaxID=2676077 RepID=UPI0012BB3552|nr:glycosyltransferase [Sphingobium sp. CAP-1]QGP79223.1 glycosyltransferase [Sphingobium sp. CAP-1]
MRIALYVHALAATGVVRNVRLLAADFQRRGHDVTLLTALPGGEGVAGVPHHALLAGAGGARSLQKWRAMPRLHGWLRATRPDLLISAGNHGHLTVLLGSRGVSGLRRIYRISNDVQRHGAARIGARGRRGRALMQRLLIADADHLILVSPTLADTPAFAHALARGHASVIENGIDVAAARASAAGPVPHPWLSQSIPVILAIGRLAPQKNFATLLTAFARLRARSPARLVILGESRDDARAALLRDADALGIAGDLLLPGAVANVFPWLAHAAAFALPSWWEGSPNVLLEAMALDRPVVASRSAGNAAAVLGQGAYGLLVDPADPAAMADALRRQIDPAIALRPGARIDAYRLDTVFDAWAGVIARLDRAPAGSAPPRSAPPEECPTTR